jgi:1-phosphatidylinositol-4-phosphate 5-kinase
MADRLFEFVKEKTSALVTSVQEHVSSVTDTTGTLAKQKLLQTLISSGVVQSEHIRHALQIGIGYFLDPKTHKTGQSSEYTQREKFPAAGSSMTPTHPLPDFDIEAYGLDIFKNLMNIYGIDPYTLKLHICQDELKEIVNPSNSGSLLYLTSDSTFLIKTVRDYDAKFIEQKFLNEYYNYVKHTPGTFISKLFGCFGYIPYLSQQTNITVDSFTLRFAIFSNFIPPKLEIHEKYDLKGSSYRRDANAMEKMKSSATFKDNDFREIHPQGLKLPKSVYYHLKEVLTRDVEFLEKLNIMDYSILLTVHNMDNQIKPTRVTSLESLMGNVRDTFLIGMTQNIDQTDKKKEKPKLVLKFRKPIETLGLGYKQISTYDTENAKEFGGIPAMNEKGERLLLFFAIIDILQTFDICKVMQRQYQTLENREVVDDRSIVEADFYAKRFKEFIFERVFHPAEDELSTHPISMNVFSSTSKH